MGVSSDWHWQAFCRVFERPDWAADPRLDTNNGRIDQGEWLLPAVAAMLKELTKQEIVERCEAAGLPFAPIARPEDLFDDPQAYRFVFPAFLVAFNYSTGIVLICTV